MTVKLFIQDPSGEREFLLEEPRISIGRLSTCSIQINEKKASKEHCVLEKEGDSWRVVDNMSSNGTLVNGKQVNAKILNEGDVIVIGETEIRFSMNDKPESTSTRNGKKKKEKKEDSEKEVVSEKKESPKPKESEKKTEKKVSKTEEHPEDEVEEPSRSKRKPAKRTESDPRAEEKRQMAQLKKFSLIGVAALVLLIVANNLYQGSQHQSAANALHQQASKLAMVSPDHKDYLKNLEEAIKLYQELEEYYSDTPFAAKASKTVKELSQKLEVEKSAEKAFRAAYEIAQSKTVEVSLFDQKRRYEEIFQKYPNSRIALKIQMEIGGLQKEMLLEVQKEFKRTQDLVATFLKNEEYGAAFSTLDEVIQKYEKESFLKEFSTQLTQERTQAESLAQAYLTKVRDRIDESLLANNLSLSQTLIEEALHNLRGTVYQSEIKVRQSALGMVSSKKMDVKTAQAEAKKKEKFFQLAQEGDRFLKARRYREALQEMKKLLENSELAQLADEKTKLMAQIEDIQKIVGLLDQLRQKINSSGLESLTIFKGHRVRLFDADDKGMGVELEGGQARSQKRWSDMTAEDYYQLFLEMNPSPQDKIAIATFCFENQLDKQAHQNMIEAVEKVSGLKDYADLLFARKSNQTIPDGGFVIYEKKFMRPEQKDQALISKNAKKLLADLGGGTADTRSEKMKQLNTLLTDAGSKHGDDFVKNLKSEIVGELKETRLKMLQDLANSSALKDVGVLKELKKELNKRRATALELIRDEVRYPYPYFPSEIEQKKVQDEVDKLVAAVEEVWNRPFDNVAQVHQGVASVTNRIKELEDQIKTFQESFNPEDEEGMNLGYIAALAGESLNIQNFGLDKREQDLIAYNKEVMRYNEQVESNATGVELKQIEITNKYRIMFGEHAVRVCDELILAARRHCEYMSSSGIFAHVIQGHPHGETPQDRCRNAGYSGGVSENCHMGIGDPLGAHVGWCHSSGHHRNILASAWRVLGSGNSGNYWTQNFGSDLGSTREKAEKLTGRKETPKDDSKKGNTGKSGGSTGAPKTGGGSTGSRPTRNEEDETEE